MGRTVFARTVVGTAGLLAVLGGAVACGGGETRVAGQVAGESSACAQIRQDVAAGRAVNVGAAQNCDQTEFAALENQRQAARAKGEKPAMQISATCQAVNARAAQGDPALDFGLAFHCRQRERFANTTNAVSGLGPANKISSLCLGERAKKARGETVDAFTESFCGKEEAAAKSGAAGGAQGAGQQVPPTRSAAPEPSQSTAPAASGEVVCPGSTVTLSGEAGAPAASSGTLPVGTKVKVTNLDNGKSTTVEVTSVSGSCMLLNDAAFEQVREAGKFLIRRARVERVG
ncbi:septal ring lytic transglycosylase RlpA family protein [Actinomadura madurae]|uniref:septal ring lytic transglycosylase RlpA family protein n=1 Tax=Actinomadura madurae TaxID=1993 RepID=UPI0020D21501|nr:septal ring lytic transglycosylase RlpA family protein [Actinomadura madurae]MCP9965320.1 septal ring lytic transglycosylase RlpA family protein [Actinomadura madurae]MCQ0010698.1 septal ring lytic transglycosylase RlpA family protein [Actinomadura madurae]MCQ0013991.1 septal ring lytic transglycosylase RlpA family protein [Actinomadura madurae]